MPPRFVRYLREASLAGLTICLLAGLATAEPRAELKILPAKIALTNIEARQTLVAQWTAGERWQGQASDATFQSSDEKVVAIKHGQAVPIANGRAIITATSADQQATVEVEVTGQDQPFQWSFRNHVESVLSKTGCNGGACHGARAGQKGFRLTLFGFDLEADHAYLTRHAQGRRIVPEDPGRSLLLMKPTGVVPHKGGVRFEPDSREYRVLAEWIAGGAPGPQPTDAVIESLEVLPPLSLQTVGAKQQMLVLAKFSDGHTEDVTAWSKFTAVNTAVATIESDGKLAVVGSGESAIKVWYLNLNALAAVSVPYENSDIEGLFANWESRNFIDEQIVSKLHSLQLPPSPLCDDATFIRRAYLDTLGTLPTAAEVRAFLADERHDKRDRLIDALLVRPEFTDYWAYKWSDLLLVNGQRLRPVALKAYYGFIRSSVAKNTPWDKFATELVTASGSTHENGAANFYALHQDPEETAETVAQAFLGLSINCAKCHNHPLEKWTNDQYYGFANMFARVKAKGWGGDFRNGDGMRVVYSDSQGELIQPSKGQPQAPRPLDGATIPFESTEDRRVAVAAWLTSPENPYFARAIANRVWANYFGVGLVERVDDLRITNPASNEALLIAAANHLVANKYDIKSLMREILRSSAYQRASSALPQNKPDERFYARYYPRRLKAEVLLDAVSQVSGAPTAFKDFPAGTRALQLPDSSVESYFLQAFGRPDRLITCDCERSDEPSMTQVLHLYNGDTLNSKLAAKDNAIDRYLAAKLPPEQIVEELYLSALARFPTAEEKQSLAAILASTAEAEKRAALEDFFWSVLSSREFLFNH
ncbi:MAG TPA: DUF1549 and DUF1553 domain-containing protein [Pirellulaceae bacterium]|nr:DUF1549 and DUF1553 domain-containing protein [Pirellulaceae bacterium]